MMARLPQHLKDQLDSETSEELHLWLLSVLNEASTTEMTYDKDTGTDSCKDVH